METASIMIDVLLEVKGVELCFDVVFKLCRAIGYDWELEEIDFFWHGRKVSDTLHDELLKEHEDYLLETLAQETGVYAT